VLPQTFEFPSNNDVSVLVALPEPASEPTGVIWFYSVIARMKPGVSKERVQADVSVVNRHLIQAYPDRFKGARANLQTQAIGLYDYLVGNVKPALLILSGAVALVLLIACVNIGNLLLARAISRRKEIAVRIALGAALGRVFRQLITESMLLASLGGIAGLALAFGGVKFLIAIAPANVPHIATAHISLPVLVFNFAIAAGSGLIFGIAPLRRATAPDPGDALKQIGRATTGGRNHQLLENLLIISEVAFAMILIVGAGLLIRTFAGLTAIPTGFRPEGVVTAQVSLPHWKYPTVAKNRAFFDNLLATVRNSPGVESAAVVGGLPYGGFAMSGALEVEGRPADHSGSNDAAVDFASDGYFESIGIPILDGRAFNRLDTAATESVAVINQAFALRYFPGERAMGKRIRVGGVTGWLRVIGVFGNVKQFGLVSETRPELFQPAWQSESGGNAQTLVVRSKVNEKLLIPSLRRQIADLDRGLPPPQIETMQNIVSALAASQRFVMQLLALFAGLALVLAAIGIYGVLVYSVEQRTKEIGIRIALGAKRGEVMRLILGRGLRLSISGALLGIVGASLATGYLRSLLYGVSPHDPSTMVIGCATIIAVAAMAAWLPARHAVAVDPMVVLRNE
jgi:predicted permease